MTTPPRMAPDLLAGLGRYLDRPISPPRWSRLAPAVQAELWRRADLHDSTPTEELFIASMAALHVARAEATNLPPRPFSDWIRYYRARMQELVTADVLGTGWRHAHREHGEIEGEAAPDNAPDARADLARLMAAVTEAEREFLDTWLALIEGGWSMREARAEAARRTGRTPNAARQLVHRIKVRNVSPFSAE